MIPNSEEVLFCIKRHQGDFVKMFLLDQMRQNQLFASSWQNPEMLPPRIP